MKFFFPRWSNRAAPVGIAIILASSTMVVGAFAYWGGSSNLEVGYQPDQPVEYSHKLHAGDLGIDCRYCHTTAESSSFAQIPPTQTCMNCHSKVRTDSARLLPVRESYATDEPIPWVRVHDLPDYAYFDHSAHVTVGVGCSTCHGRVDQMPKVTQVEPLSMGWCLDCHRNPAPKLRDPKDVTKMDWVAPKEPVVAMSNGVPVTKSGRKIQPPLHCSGCHR